MMSVLVYMEQIQSRILANTQKNNPAQFVGSIARLYGQTPAQVLNKTESITKVQNSERSADRNLPHKKNLTVGPGKLPISRSLPSYPR